MSNLQEYTSLYDKNSRLAAEPKPKDMNPQNGDFYTEEGVSNSPFNSEDHLVDLLQDKLVQSNNSGVTYNPAAMQGYYPGPPGGDQDFDGRDDGQGIFTSKTKYDGKKVKGEDLHVHLLNNNYVYSHGNSIANILNSTRDNSNSGGGLDLNGSDLGNGLFHGIDKPELGQGRQINGVDLHEHLLQNSYTYTHGRTSNTVLPSNSLPNSGKSPYQDLDLDIRNEGPQTYKDRMAGTGGIF